MIATAVAALTAVPASAGPLSTELSSQVYLDGPGVDVRIGDRDRYRHRHWRDREVRGDRCKTVTVTETLPNGTRVKRTRSNC
jgi:hypothetical protein